MRANLQNLLVTLILCVLTGRAQAAGDELRISCPSGTFAVVESETSVICRRKDPPAAPAVSTAPPAAVTGQTGMELSGLQSVPETCGLHGAVSFDVAENTAEQLYLAVSACVEAKAVAAPAGPARWLEVQVLAAGAGHRVEFPDEPWLGSLQGCVLRKPPRLPRGSKGKTFKAYYLIMGAGQERPPPPACVQSHTGAR